MKAFLGFDTSCYTTSVALIDDAGNLLAAQRRLLFVKEASRGLRQQEMVFQHLRALPELYRKARDSIKAPLEILAVAASTKPRDRIDSYMPAFCVGEEFAKVIASTLCIPMVETDHQAGHIEAGRMDHKGITNRHLVMHLSGGTTEILTYDHGSVQCIGGSKDISMGQLVDRTGVAMGLPFPAGPALESLAMSALARGETVCPKIGVSVQGCDCHLSGAEAQVIREMQAGNDHESLALSLYDHLANLTHRLLLSAGKATGITQTLLVGGVASSALYRDLLLKRLAKGKNPMRVYFAQPEHSSDNAVGVAHIALQKTL